ncbi:hypothetical protein QTO34_002620 [Cnephaeus nilssonii]|uniref:Uncharacterized protein n=1 Tax=Cnephaeus nilssonii TaxID=3371016 RepID=A0AA40LLJ8_CNENI|nr:hypothetical protein QTO34_002620 [Eptesicus nilssonii]
MSAKEYTKLLLGTLRSNLLQECWRRKEAARRQRLLDPGKPRAVADRAQPRLSIQYPIGPVETAAMKASKRICQRMSQAQQTDDSSPHHQEQGEVEKSSGVIRAGSHHSYPLTAPSDWGQRQAPAVGVRGGSGASSGCEQSWHRQQVRAPSGTMEELLQETPQIAPTEINSPTLDPMERKETVNIQEEKDELDEEELQELLSKLMDAFTLEMPSDPQSSVNTDLYRGAEQVSRAFSALVDQITLPNWK